MSYFRGLSADPWANAAEPGLLGQLTNALTSGLDKLASVVGAPAPAPHPAPLTEAEKQRLLGTATPPTATLPVGGSSKLPLLLGVAAVAGLGFFLLKRRRPVANPARRRRRNPRTFTKKGERMYRHIARGYGKSRRAKEIAARTVYAAARRGVRGLVKKGRR